MSRAGGANGAEREDGGLIQPVPPSVIATVRNMARSGALVEAAGSALGRTLEVKQLDVCDEASIRACLDSIPGRRVDVLGEPRLCVALQLPTHGARAAPCTRDTPHWGHPAPGTCRAGVTPCTRSILHVGYLLHTLGTFHC